jgi:hypothetical protein
MSFRHAIAVVAASLPLMAAASTLKPGKYEYIQSINGGPPGKGSVCITQADIDRHLEFIGGESTAEKCTYKSYKETGNAVVFDVACPTGDGHGEYSFTDDSYSGKSAWSVPAEHSPGGRAATVTTGATSSRMGSCKE